jgi:hypothetical protein
VTDNKKIGESDHDQNFKATKLTTGSAADAAPYASSKRATSAGCAAGAAITAATAAPPTAVTIAVDAAFGLLCATDDAGKSGLSSVMRV